MASPLVPTVLNFSNSHTVAPPRVEPYSTPNPSARSSLGTQGAIELGEQSTQEILHTGEDDGELKLPKMRSLAVMISTNVLLQTTLFIIVSSGSEYAEHLGGNATFSGLVVGIPAVIFDRCCPGQFALHLCCASALAGSILYALAYKAHFLYLILIARIVTGVSFAQFMYTKRYCSDPRIVGVRRRTTLAGWLVVGQNAGFTLGPFLGGVLYKIGFGNAVFNGYTSPGWVMAAAWLIFWAVVVVSFEDVPRCDSSLLSTRWSSRSGRSLPSEGTDTEMTTLPPPAAAATATATDPAEPTQGYSHDVPAERISAQQWAVTATMCWFAMTCFFILGAWEVNIPIFSARAFGASPFVAGNLIALGGVCTFPFMFANVVLARRVQDRYILAAGSALGLLGLLVAIVVVFQGRATLGNLFACWFFVALGFNLASTVTLSLLSKQMPHAWNGKISMFIQYSNYAGRVCGAVWGGAGVGVGMTRYVGLQLGFLGIGGLMFMTLWKEMKAKTG